MEDMTVRGRAAEALRVAKRAEEQKKRDWLAEHFDDSDLIEHLQQEGIEGFIAQNTTSEGFQLYIRVHCETCGKDIGPSVGMDSMIQLGSFFADPKPWSSWSYFIVAQKR